MVENNFNGKAEKRADLERVIRIIEKLSGLDAKFDSLLVEFLKDREFKESEIKEILGRLTLLEREGTTVMREGLQAQHTIIDKLVVKVEFLEHCKEVQDDNYARLKWIIGSVTVIIVPVLTATIVLILNNLLGF